MSSIFGGSYAPDPIPAPVLEPGAFTFAAVGLDHGHIYGMSNGLLGAGATLKWVYDPDPAKVAAFAEKFPQVKVASSEDEVLDDAEVGLVAGAAVTAERCAGSARHGRGQGLLHGQGTPHDARAARRGERSRSPHGPQVRRLLLRTHPRRDAVFASQLIEAGAIGRVVQVIGLGPHRLWAASRPAWFFGKDKYGGILCDIGSHQIEQILHYTGSADGRVVSSQIANYANPEHPGLDDFGDATIVTDTGASGYFRCDWFTPDGLQMWGDGRTFILGTEGFIEQRKYMNIGTDDGPAHVYLANRSEETHFDVQGKVGYPFFGQFVLDCLERTENAMTQEHAFKAVELAIRAQMQAVDLVPRG